MIYGHLRSTRETPQNEGSFSTESRFNPEVSGRTARANKGMPN